MYPTMVAELDNHTRVEHALTIPTAASRPKKPRRPTLQLKHGGCLEEEWTFFKHQFAQYKTLSNLTANEPRHLQECLDVELQQLLYATIGVSISTMTEVAMLAQVEKLAVRDI